MSSVARVHTQASIRAQPKKKKKERPKEGDAEQKVVFRSVLDNPFIVSWPPIPLNVQNAILAILARILVNSGISQYHEERERLSRKSKQSRRALKSKATEGQQANPATSLKRKSEGTDKDHPMSKKRKLNEKTHVSSLPNPSSPPTANSSSVVSGATEGSSGAEPPAIIEPPATLQNLVLGINEVTKRLEIQTQLYRRALASHSTPQTTDKSTNEPKTPSSIRYVFVCLPDINPPTLVEHFPPLIAACNASRPTTVADSAQFGRDLTKDPDVILISLPKMAEGTLTELIGLRRVAVMALDAQTKGIEELDNFVASTSIPALLAPWLIPPYAASEGNANINPAATGSHVTIVQPSSGYVPTLIKQVRTTAPKDMKGAKEARTKGRAEARAERPAPRPSMVLDYGEKEENNKKK